MSLPIPPGSYGIDTHHSQIGFSVTHLGISVVRGMFDDYAGSLSVGETLDDTHVSVTAEVASINSGNRARDETVHNGDYFDLANFRQMTFESTSIAEHDGAFRMHGHLTIKGVTLPVEFDVVYNGSNVFPIDKSTHFGFRATAVISRTAFGMPFAVPLISDEVPLELDVQFVSPATT